MEWMFVKYVSWLMGAGVAFVGAWFSNFRKEDPSTGRRYLTTLGRIACILASLALLGNLALMVRSDRAASQATAEQQELRDAEKEWRNKTDELLTIISDHVTNLTPSQARGIQAIAEDIPNFSTTYLDLDQKLDEALEFGNPEAVMSTLKAGIERDWKNRIAKSEWCQSNYVYEQHGASWRMKTAGGLLVSFRVYPDGIYFSFWHPPSGIDSKDSIYFKFPETGTSAKCDHKVLNVTGCAFHTKNPPALDLIKLISSHPIGEIRIFPGKYRYEFLNNEAKNIQMAARCLTP